VVETSGKSQEKGLYEGMESPKEDVRRAEGECQRAYKSKREHSKQFWAMSLPSQRHMYAFWEDAKTACGGPRFLGYPSI